MLLDELAEAVVDGTRKQYMESITSVLLLIVNDLGIRKLPMTAAVDFQEIILRRHGRATTLLTSKSSGRLCYSFHRDLGVGKTNEAFVAEMDRVMI